MNIMKLDKKSILIVASVTIVVLLLVSAAFLLIRGIMQFNDSEARLVLAKKRLKELYDKAPFPSQVNVDKEKENVTILNEWFMKFVAAMRKSQIEPVQKSPTVFLSLLQGKVPELIQQGNASSKVVADDFGFGFERYLTSGTPPEPNDVPRLTQQLMIVEKLCEVLFSAKVEKVLEIQREMFEENVDAANAEAAARPGAAGGRGRAAPVSGKGKTAVSSSKLLNKNAGLLREEDLYARFRFIADFKAKESVVLEVLNQLARNEMFIVVVSIDAARESSDLADIKLKMTPPASATAAQTQVVAADPLAFLNAPAAAATAQSPASAQISTNAEKASVQVPEEKLARLERIVCGPDFEKTIRVKLMLDVYRFRGE